MQCLQFIYVSLLLLDDQLAALSDGACLGLKIAYWGVVVLSFDASEVILTLRTWILCGKQRWVAKMLITFSFILHIVVAIVISLTFAFATFDDIDIPGQPWVDCVLRSSVNKLWVIWLLLLIHDAALCTLLASWAYNECKAKRVSPSVMRIYKEAIMYYLFILVLDLTGLLSTAIHQDELFLSLSLPLVVRQLLTARVVLYSWKKGHIHSDCEQDDLTTLEVDNLESFR
ncbi:hypothetical protein M378DRAFT_593612 [Amanita muscaria Koide BX008]|uniref:Uncharacterized protein n=1 Tax=Amanita muscaria (strain Koide BX008) TaxID=946122 RepID=A0A0C2X4Y1_AMAMK|nr:hypothetical protein M378DRAFT_593612 [Amanita muscaria Koide BX008]